MTHDEKLAALFTEVSNEVRSRREPEMGLTAASLAAFGAVSWGVAALPGRCHVVLVACVGIAFSIVAVVWKIRREHSQYKIARLHQNKIAQELFASLDDGLTKERDAALKMSERKQREKALEKIRDRLFMPVGYWQPAGTGHRGAIWIVIVSGVVAIAFCIAVGYSSTTH